MKDQLDLQIERARREEKYFKNYKFYAGKIKKASQELLGEVKVFVFGSVLKENEVPQDIDILIISPKLKTTAQKSKARAQLWKKLGFSSPFEIHLINPEEYQQWYKFFIKEKVKI